MIEFAREVFATLGRNKLRTLLTAFSVAWGLFMLVILLAAGSGLENGVEWEFRDDAVNSMAVAGGMTSIPYAGRRTGRDIHFKTPDYEAVPRHVPEVEHITGRFYLWGEFTVSRKDKRSSFEVRGVNPGHQHLEKTEMVAGRYLNELDIQERRKVAVIGSIAKTFLFGEQAAVGEYIKLRGLEYKVVGVFEDAGGEAELRRIFVPITTAQFIYNVPDAVHQILFTLGDTSVERSKEIETTLRHLMAKRHQFSPEDRRAVRVHNNLERFVRITRVFTWINAFVWIVGIGTLLAGVVGVSNLMLISVAERTREIGIRKALGATPASLVGMIVAESLVITASAGYAGLVAAVGAVEIVRRLWPEVSMLRNPEVDLTTALIAGALTTLAGVVSGLVPAWRAARVNPITALREGD